MKLFKNLSKLQIGIFALLVCGSGVLGYLFYDTNRTNIQDKELIKQTKTENLDLSQDLAIVKDKYDRLLKINDVLKGKVGTVHYQKKKHKTRLLYSAGRSSKYGKHKVNYKKLYFQLKKRCEMHRRR